jgi:hypothetical protein
MIMKKTLLILSALVLIFAEHEAQAQIINPGFETWSADLAVPSAMNPNSGNNTFGWCDYNFFNSSLVGSSPLSVFRCDTAHSGTYSCRIKTAIYSQTSWNIYKLWGIPFIGHIYYDTLGIVFDGKLNETNATYTPGIPCTQKLGTFSFYYQYTPNGVDTAECRVLLIKSHAAVAGGAFKTSVATSGWQLATINFLYVDTVTPDTLYVLFSSSSLDHNPKPGSVYWIDDVSITLATGVNQVLSFGKDMEVFPNPTNGIFTLREQKISNEPQTVEIYNVLGEKVYTNSNFNKQLSNQIDISAFPKGVYFIKLYDGENVYLDKLLKQ